MILSSPQHGIISFSQINSENLPGPILPGSNILYHENDFGTILIQQHQTVNYTLRFVILKLVKKLTLLFEDESYLLKDQMSLKGDLLIERGRKTKVHMKEGEYILYKKGSEPVTGHFESGTEYKLFNSSFSESVLTELFTAFPSLKAFLENSNNNEKIAPHRSSFEMKTIVFDLLMCPYDEHLRRIYFENKVNDFLFAMLAQSFSSYAGNDLEEKEDEAVFEARNIIHNNLTRHYTIKELSQMVQLNEHKLKTGFRRKFGLGIFEYLMQMRMEQAQQLLISTNKPIKEIAALTGFAHLTNFITAFRKYFGYTPASLRRK